MTVPTPFNVTNPLLEFTVASAKSLLEYVTESGLAPLAVTVNAASVTFFVVGGFTNARLIVAFETVSGNCGLQSVETHVAQTDDCNKITGGINCGNAGIAARVGDCTGAIAGGTRDNCE